MNRHTPLVVAVAALVVATGAVAAAPSAGSTPIEQPAQGDAGEMGPPTDLPSPVPDFVSDIHDLVGQFLDGALDALGPNVSDAAGNGASTATPTQ
ncbi:MAG: hypothetical protein ABEK02_04635 [Haloquadratum sp.]